MKKKWNFKWRKDWEKVDETEADTLKLCMSILTTSLRFRLCGTATEMFGISAL